MIGTRLSMVLMSSGGRPSDAFTIAVIDKDYITRFGDLLRLLFHPLGGEQVLNPSRQTWAQTYT